MMAWLLGNYSIIALTGKIRNISLEKKAARCCPGCWSGCARELVVQCMIQKMLQYGLSPEQQLTVQIEKVAVTRAA